VSNIFKSETDELLVLIGGSTGGPNALATILSSFKEELGVPVMLVQHIPKSFSTSLASLLDKKCVMNVIEPKDGQRLKANNVYLAPGDLHMIIAPSGRDGHYIIRLRDTEPVKSCKPAADVLFKSVAKHYNGAVLVIVITGMGNDGTDGVEAIKNSKRIKYSHCITQSEKTCIVYGMPGRIVDHDLSDEQVDLEEIGERIVKIVNREKRKILRK